MFEKYLLDMLTSENIVYGHARVLTATGQNLHFCIMLSKICSRNTLGILGHTTIIKPLPESSGTIYFNATGTDSRNSDSFKLLLELETTRMQQLSNLLYVDPS